MHHHYGCGHATGEHPQRYLFASNASFSSNFFSWSYISVWYFSVNRTWLFGSLTVEIHDPTVIPLRCYNTIRLIQCVSRNACISTRGEYEIPVLHFQLPGVPNRSRNTEDKITYPCHACNPLRNKDANDTKDTCWHFWVASSSTPIMLLYKPHKMHRGETIVTIQTSSGLRINAFHEALGDVTIHVDAVGL